MQKKILLTGSTGVIGRKFCDKLFQKGYEITIFTSNPKIAKRKIEEPIEF